MNANLLISAGATAATSPVMTLDSMAASGGVTSSAGSALFMMPTPSMQFQTEPVRWTSEDMAVLTALSLDATAAAVPTSAADPRASDDAMAPLTPNFVLPWDSPATLAAMIDRAVAEASVAAPSQTSSSSTITSPATSSGTDSRPVVMARRSFLLDDDQSAATISSSATSPLRFSSSSRCQQRSDDACDCCHDDDHTAAGDLPRSQMLEPSQCRPVGTEPWSIQAAGPVHVSRKRGGEMRKKMCMEYLLFPSSSHSQKLWSTAVDAAGMTLTARTEAPAEPLPLGRCRQMAYRTDGTARVVLTTLLPDAEFQSQEPSRRPNRLVVMDVELRDGRSGGTDNDMGTSAAASATASAASAAEGGRPAVPTLSTKYQAGLAFDSLVRAFCIIPSDRGDQHVAVASGDQVSLWRLTENDSDAAEFLPLWSKNGGRQVRDMARRHNLLAWGGNVGRLRCLDLSRPEDPSKSFLVAEFYARSLHQSIASIRWRPEDSACVVSLTTDSGDFQVRDIRDR